MTAFNTNYSYRRPSKKAKGNYPLVWKKRRDNALLAVRSNAPSKQNVHGGSKQGTMRCAEKGT